MGQYHYPVHLTKKPYLNPPASGDGRKLREVGYSNHGTMTVSVSAEFDPRLA